MATERFKAAGGERTGAMGTDPSPTATAAPTPTPTPAASDAPSPDEMYPTRNVASGRVVASDVPLGEDFASDAPFHNFMVTRPSAGGTHPIELAANVRDGIETMPESKAMFRLRDVLDDGGRATAGLADYRVVELAGAWPVPDAFATGNDTRWVNPTYTHARYYSDAVARCACGAVRLHKHDAGESPLDDHMTRHADDCPVDARLRTRARIHANRRCILTRMLLCGQSASAQSARLGVRPDEGSRATTESHRVCVDITTLRERGRERRARTCARLLATHDPDTIGRAYGISGHTVRTSVNNYTAANAKALYEYRRDNE